MVGSNIRTAFAAMAGMGSLLGGIGSSEATLVQTFGVDEQGGPTSQSLFFDAATPNTGGNGALTEVTIAFSTLTVGGGDQATVLVVTGGEGATAIRGGLTADLAISDAAGALFSGSTSVAASTCTSGFAGCTGTLMTPSQPTFTPSSPIFITDGGSLADFVGGPVQISALISNYDLAATTCTSTHHEPSPCGGSDNITWAPTVTVSYTYDAPTIDAPEPATLSVLGFAGAALALLRRRRKPNRTAAL